MKTNIKTYLNENNIEYNMCKGGDDYFGDDFEVDIMYVAFKHQDTLKKEFLKLTKKLDCRKTREYPGYACYEVMTKNDRKRLDRHERCKWKAINAYWNNKRKAII